MSEKKVEIQYYAFLREERGITSEYYLTEANNLAELYEEMKNKFGFSLVSDVMRVALNDQFVSWDTHIKEDDKIIFIPPVAGG